jgi:hypothetical protein
MADIPFPILGHDVESLRNAVIENFRDLYTDKIAGTSIGDVFRTEGNVLTLRINESSGLCKNDDSELDIDRNASTISNLPSGNIEAMTVQTALNEIDNEKLIIGGSAEFNSVQIQDPISSVPGTPTGKSVIYIKNGTGKINTTSMTHYHGTFAESNPANQMSDGNTSTAVLTSSTSGNKYAYIDTGVQRLLYSFRVFISGTSINISQSYISGSNDESTWDRLATFPTTTTVTNGWSPTVSLVAWPGYRYYKFDYIDNSNPSFHLTEWEFNDFPKILAMKRPNGIEYKLFLYPA